MSLQPDHIRDRFKRKEYADKYFGGMWKGSGFCVNVPWNFSRWPERMITELPHYSTVLCIGCGPSFDGKDQIARLSAEHNVDCIIISYPFFLGWYKKLEPLANDVYCIDSEIEPNCMGYYREDNKGKFIFDALKYIQEGINFGPIWWFCQSSFSSINPTGVPQLDACGTGNMALLIAADYMHAQKIVMAGIDHEPPWYSQFEADTQKILAAHPAIKWIRLRP